MKTNQVGNESLPNARESLAHRSGLATIKTRRAGRNEQANCVTPARPVPRSPRERIVGRHAPLTKILAKTDIGFGNTLFIRGEGAGLSWDKGQPLQCVESSVWMWSRERDATPITFKLLINDQLWCRGANLTATPGSQTEVVPAF